MEDLENPPDQDNMIPINNEQKINLNNNQNNMNEENKDEDININSNNNNIIDSSNFNNEILNELSKLNSEKANLLSTLRKEMIINEEQRNYIQILKEIIESNLFKSGFASIIASSKDFEEYKKKNNKNIGDYFIDYTKCRKDYEDLKKDCFELSSALKEAQFTINESKNKILKLNNQNEILNKDNIKKK